MNVTNIVKKTLSLVTPNMHVYRRNSLIKCVESLVAGNAATVTTLGRGINSSAKEKHNIKRADRLLSNSNLQNERLIIYRQLAHLIVGKSKQPIIIVDWSDLDEYKRHFLLRATLASHGRGLCLYEEVHDIKTKEKAITHEKFLSRLAQILPKHSRPIIVTDAGFKTPWFRSVLAQGWDFLGRTRLPNFYSIDNEHWQCITHLYRKATSSAKVFSGQIARRNPLSCQLIIYKQKAKGRKALNRSGIPSRSKYAKVYSKTAKDPWLLTTSLSPYKKLAKRAVKIYQLRMQIEEGFRDMKSRRYGLGFEYNKTTNIKRMAVLILLTTLAHWILMLLGMMSKLTNTYRQYKANTVKSKNTLSLHFIGLRVAANKHCKLLIRDALSAIKELQRTSGYCS